MKVTTISKKKYKELHKLVLEDGICNSESIVYDINIRGERKILKELKEKEGEYYATKLYTVQMLDSSREYLPKGLCIPDSLAVVKGETIGFTVPYVEGINLATILNSTKVSVDEQIYYLRKIGQLLEQLRNVRKYTPLKDFYINDLHESNFIVNPNNRELTAIDLDSSKIGANGVYPSRYASPCSLAQHVPSKYIVNESGRCGGFLLPNDDSEIYCYVMTILNYLFGGNIFRLRLEDFYVYLNYLDKIGIDKELLMIIERIVSCGPNVNPEPYLESLTAENVSRAREKVYTLTKNNIMR